jgi:ElaB/YqjD/DUF883 family membrane-anchored ribosome-binding protein
MREKTKNGNNVDLEQFLEDIKLVVRDGQELLRAGLGAVRERARYGADRTDQVVHERPYQTLGLAFGMGLLVGLLACNAWSRREDSVED